MVDTQLNQTPGPISNAEQADEIPLHEIRELMWHASESGNIVDEEVLRPLSEALGKYERASGEDRAGLRGQLLARYAVLTRRTFPVTGHTLLDTRNVSGLHLRRLMLLTMFVLFLAVANEGLAVWLVERPKPVEGLEQWLFEFRNSFLEFLSPFIWGALGACVYLMKRLYDRAKEREFDSRKLQGWSLRLLLGAILGAIVFHVYDIAVLSGNEGYLDADVLAFFTGVGVKVVYGAIERTVDGLAESFNVREIRQKRRRPQDAKDVLTGMLAETDPIAAPEKQKAILDTLDELDRRG